MDKFLKYAPLLSLLSLVTVVIGGVYFFGGEMTTIKEGSFTPTEKVEIQTYMKNKISPEQQQRKHILDSINTQHAIISRAKRDSINDVNTKTNKLNADQLFQIKEQIKKAHPNN